MGKGVKTEWDDQYVRERSNSKNGVLVEMRLYSEGDRLVFVLGRATEALAEISRESSGYSGYADFVQTGPGVQGELEMMMGEIGEDRTND